MLLFGVLGEEPPLLIIWSIFIGFGILGLVLSALRWWASIPILGILLLYSLMLFSDFYATDLYPAILREDANYITFASAGIVLGLILPFIGIAFKLARRLKPNT
jgi:hypothetical protein